MIMSIFENSLSLCNILPFEDLVNIAWAKIHSIAIFYLKPCSLQQLLNKSAYPSTYLSSSRDSQHFVWEICIQSVCKSTSKKYLRRKRMSFEPIWKVIFTFWEKGCENSSAYNEDSISTINYWSWISHCCFTHFY